MLQKCNLAFLDTSEPTHFIHSEFTSYLSSWCSDTPGRARVAGGRSPTEAASPVRCSWPRSHTGSTGSSGCSGWPCPGPLRWMGSGWSPLSGALYCEALLDTPWYCVQEHTHTHTHTHTNIQTHLLVITWTWPPKYCTEHAKSPILNSYKGTN